MDTKPIVSVLVPLYNGIEFLKTALESVKYQTFSFWEVIVGINGHGSGGEVASQCLDILADLADPRIQMIIQPNVRGKVESLHGLLGEAKGKWIALLDCDDAWHLEKLQRQFSALNGEARNADILGTFCQYFGEFQGSPQIPGGWIGPKHLASSNPIINSSALIRKEVCMDLGWRYTDICYGMEDYDFWMRAERRAYTLYNVPEILTYHRIHSTSAFNTKGQDPSALQAWYKKQLPAFY